MVTLRRFGAAGPELPTIGQGTWNMEQGDRRQVVAALQRGLELGMNHIDTAEMYGSGAVEAIVGEAIRGRREQLYLVSKVMPHNASRRGTVAACERSLELLGTDYLDLYLLHWRGPHPLAETFAAFETLIERGAIRAFGVSNFTADDIDEAVSVAGAGRIACNQVCYYLGARTIEHFVVPRCAELGIAVVGYSPFGSGAFPAPNTRGGKVLAEVAAGHGCSARQVALAFLLRHPATFTIPKAARIEHVEDNAAAASLSLDDSDVDAIAAAFPLGRPRHDVPII